MKNKLLVLIGILGLTSCVKKGESNINSRFNPVHESSVNLSNMNYKVFYHGNGGITVINTTKDSLEVEALKTQINVNNKFYEE